MNKRCREDIARDAWKIYKQTIALEKSILEAFLDDFMIFEELQQRQPMIKEQELPF